MPAPDRPHRDRRPASALALLVGLLALRSAPAAPHTEHFGALGSEVDARLVALGDGTTRQERRAVRDLESVRGQLARAAVDLRHDVGIARRVERRLGRRFADDAVLEPLLDALSENLVVETRVRGEAIVAEVDAVLGVRPILRARRAAEGAAELVARADGTATRRKVLALLRRALDRLRRADGALRFAGRRTVEQTLEHPVAELADSGIVESSGIVFVGGAYWTHNDSAGAPVLYRAADLTFTDAEALAVPGATNVDWEDLTTLDGDVVVCDAGDNDRVRDDYVLYRARYVPADGAPARLELVATYPFAYPDGRHDCEAAAVIDGHVVLVIKQADETDTGIYRFETLTDVAELGPGTTNVPTRIAGLTLGFAEQVTAASVYRGRGPLVLLTYFRVLVYDPGALDSAPTRSVALHFLATRQAEALCFAGDRLVITNEQRDVFAVHDFLTRE